MSTKSAKLYVQYGCGNQAVPGWINFDASPTLRIQKLWLIGRLLRSKLNCIFDKDVRFGDITLGLPIKEESCDGLFCSHVLEHLSYDDFSTALKNSFLYLKPGGVFRIIVPCLQYHIDKYQTASSSDNSRERARAAIEFCKGTCFGIEGSRSTFLRRLKDAFANSGHRWMWDYSSLAYALSNHGFVDIRKFERGNCDDEMFLRPERDHQFIDNGKVFGLAIECRKPF
jgi:hypothetical protein